MTLVVVLLGLLLLATVLVGALLLRRARQRQTLASTQDLLGVVEHIEFDIVILRDGGRRAVLEVGGISYALRPPDEQDMIFAGFERLLNGIDYPLQILVQVTPTDVEGYIEHLLKEYDGSLPGLRVMLDDHVAFVRSLARERELFDRHFRIVIPGDPPAAGAGQRGGGLLQLFTVWRRPSVDSAAATEQARRMLAWRCNQVGEGLGAIGVPVERLHGDDLATLWRDAIIGWRPRRARRWIDPSDASPVVTGILDRSAAFEEVPS